jgi:hypothetical protein
MTSLETLSLKGPDGTDCRPSGAPLLEADVREIERRLRLHRENSPKRIAADMRVHVNTISAVNLGRHRIQKRTYAGGRS